MKILRLTRHPAEERQLSELHRLFGEDVEVVEVAETVPDVERVKAIVVEYGADVLEAVLPITLMAKCVDSRDGLGVPVIRAITVRHLEPDGSARFEFSHYERILKVEVVTERL